MLLDRGRSSEADRVCDEAARLAPSDGHVAVALDARLWQVAARTDAGRLTEAESLCRALLITGTLLSGRLAWARALLARTLLWQERTDEAVCLDLSDTSLADAPDTVVAFVIATAVRALLAGGDVFAAGQRSRALLGRLEHCADPLPRLIAQTAHLRVLAATGDLTLSGQCFLQITYLAREARAPLRAARARVIWYDALRRAGRAPEAQRELESLGRISRASPPLLRRAIDDRLASASSRPPAPAPSWTVRAPRGSSTAAMLLRLAHDEESDANALRRIM